MPNSKDTWSISLDNQLPEICDNGIDDDLDGLIDLFDPDCNCNNYAFQAACQSSCDIVPDSFPTIDLELKWVTKVLTNVATTPSNYTVGNDFAYLCTSETKSNIKKDKIIRIDLITGISTPYLFLDSVVFNGFTNFSMLKFNQGDIPTFFLSDLENNFYSINESESVFWKNTDYSTIANFFKSSKLANFNRDNFIEVYSDNLILNAHTGKLLLEAGNSKGCNFNTVLNLCNLGANSIAGDFTDHSGLELACGNMLYEINLNNAIDSVGNTFNTITAPSPVLDGFNSMADVDGDGFLDIIVVRSNHKNDGGIWVWNPRDTTIITQADPIWSKGLSGGLASIGDLDNDCFPEIVVSFEYQLRVYSFDGSKTLKLRYILPTTDESGVTGVTLFDLNQDGMMEIIYRDETELKIIDGPTGTTITSYPVLSRTWTESPIVSDVDDDGQAEIIVSGGIEHKDSIRLFCFESALEPWAPARKVWNQTGYHVTNVNDDLTIPRYQQNMAAFFDTDSCAQETCPQVYNAFGVQATYRTQEGCRVWSIEDCIEDEICDNGIDDDLDGLVDLFDPDCSCNESAYQAQCHPECEIVPDSFSEIKMKLKWQSPVVSDFANFTIPLVIPKTNNKDGYLYYKGLRGVMGNSINKVFKISSLDGNLMDSFDIMPDNLFFSAKTNPSIGRLGDSLLIFLNDFKNLYCYNELGSLKWKRENTYPNVSNLVDFDHDGVFEVYVGYDIINSQNGNFLLRMDKDGCSANPECSMVQSIAFDILPRQGVELICGKHIYSVNLNNKSDSLGNTFTTLIMPDPVLDGYCAIADFNNDGLNEILVSRGNEFNDGGIWLVDPNSQTLLAEYNSVGIESGLPKLADLDGDCIPEIVVTFENELRIFKYDGTKILKPIFTKKTTDRSGWCSASIFDLNQDGKMEIIYRDETVLYIFNNSGAILDSITLKSKTAHEFPVIADIDGNGSAEILIDGYLTNVSECRLFCFESALEPWAPARKVWNQTGYHVTNVNDDLTIPRYQQNMAAFFDTDSCAQETCPQVYNTFGVQATYRTQQGCRVWPTQGLDFSIKADVHCFETNYEACVYALGADSTALANGIPVSIYYTFQDSLSEYLLIVTDTISSDTTCFILPYFTDTDSIFIVLNDDSVMFPPTFENTYITECDYSNNVSGLKVEESDFSMSILNYSCTRDSIQYCLEVQYDGPPLIDSCVGIACYFEHPSESLPALEITGHCFKFDSTKTILTDTICITVPFTPGEYYMYWTINDAGIGPGIDASEITGHYECDYLNNIDVIYVSLDPLSLNLGPDITKCQSEVITLIANPEFTTYLWNDLTTDSIYSSSFEGLHYVEATDECGRVYRDTVEIIIDEANDIDLGADIDLCPSKSQNITISGDFDQVNLFPTNKVDCDTCLSVNIISDTSFQLIVIGQKGSCVSIDTMEISIIPQTIVKDTITICEGDDYTVQDSLLKTAGIYTFDLNDCDSLFQLDLRVIPMLATKDTTMICKGDSIEVGGVWLSEAGIYPFTYPTNAGCDSMVELALMVQDISASYDEMYICPGDSIMIFGEWQKEEDLYTTTFQSIAGCDSLVSITLRQYKDYAFFDTIALCNGDSIQVGGQWVKTEGATAIPLQTVNGCDSTYNVFLSFGGIFMKTEPITICQGDSTLIDTIWVKEAGAYPVTFQNNSGCDSLITYQVSIQEITNTLDTIDLCIGDSIQINSKWVKEGGLYRDTLPDGICYKISTTLIQELPTKTSKAQFTLCPSDSIQINGSWLKEAGEYEFMLMTKMGCDSILTAEIILLENPTPPDIFLDCDALEILAEISADNTWTITWDNGQEGEFAMYSSSGMGSVSLISPPDCEVVYEFDLPSIPSVPDFLQLKDTLVYTGSTLSYDLNLNEDDWIIEWVSPMESGCNYCSKANFSVFKPSSIVLNLEHIESGCTYTTTINVDVVRADILVPNVFSPNRDEINDTWEVDLSDYENPETMIFDRWGNLMYKSYSSYPMWRGIFNSKNVNPGVYVYVIKYGASSERKIQTGDITVIR